MAPQSKAFPRGINMKYEELKKERAEKTLALQNKVKGQVDKYSEDVANRIIAVLKQDEIDWDHEYDFNLNVFYTCFEDVYALVSKTAKDIYKDIKDQDEDKEIDIKELRKLTYNKDGLTLEERVAKHFKDYMKNTPTKERFLYDMVRILNTESLCLMNNLIMQKINPEYAEIEDSSCCELCSDWADEGPIPIDDFEEPPYHPNCECIPIFFTKEEIED